MFYMATLQLSEESCVHLKKEMYNWVMSFIQLYMNKNLCFDLIAGAAKTLYKKLSKTTQLQVKRCKK